MRHGSNGKGEHDGLGLYHRAGISEELDWVRAFVESEVRRRVHLLRSHQEQLGSPRGALKQEVKRQGLWAAHLDRELGGQAWPAEPRLLHESSAATSWRRRSSAIRPDSGNAELLAVGANEEQKQRWLWPLLDGRLRSSFALTSRSSPAPIRRRSASMAVRDGDPLGAQRPQVVCLQRRRRRLRAGDGRDQSGGGAARARRHDRHRTGTPGLEIVRNVGTMAHPDRRVSSNVRTPGRTYGNPLPRLSGAGGQT